MVVINRDFVFKIKKDIKELYNIKFSLDEELSILFVEKISVFYKEFYNLYDSYTLEAPEPKEYSKQLFSSDLEKMMKAYSELIYFKPFIEDITGNKIEIPRQIHEVWFVIKTKYIEDFITKKFFEKSNE
ncbi:hypothetical protein EYB33_00610 (plasmid) [Lysinibacillus sphaericus]|uniref:hypothetical protein n=1 Tax=Lysinibacillus sphaericus TaxID=1421 RepID=UPI001E3D4E29|nr:hypothetical protein [Lysinibacillus sphaericus]UDK94884.1 hypothetical protein EYB33_00610 [Lysinibacillus sphaericus]